MKDLVTPADYKFGERIVREYPEISLNDLYTLMYSIRYHIEITEQEFLEMHEGRQMELSDIKNKLSPGTKIRNIVINTNKGPLTIYNYGNIYKNLYIAAKRILPKYKDLRETDLKVHKYLMIDYPFKMIADKIRTTSLGSDQKRIVIGMLLVHFKLWSRKPLMTQKEFDDSSIIGTYKRYLSDIVKSKLKTLSD